MSRPYTFQSTPPRRRRPQHIVIPQLSCAYLVSTTFLSTIFSFISQYIVLFPLFRVRMPCVFCVAYDSHYVPLFNIFYILFQGIPFNEDKIIRNFFFLHLTISKFRKIFEKGILAISILTNCRFRLDRKKK